MRLISCIFILFSVLFIQAQTENEIVNDYIERYIENTEDEVDIQQFADELLSYFNRPIDLNRANAVELYNTPFLTGNQVREIAKHRQEFGDFISIYELQVLPSFTPAEIRHLAPFVTINQKAFGSLKLSDIWLGGEHQIMSLVEGQFPRKKGFLIADTASDNFTGNKYDGSAAYANLRYRFDYKNQLSFGFNAEKDAGESFLSDNQPYGFDYYSFYFSAKNVGKIKHLQLGDFQANFGQGLTLSTGLAFGKSSIITNSKRNSKGFGPYRSLRENAYLRGGAIAFDFNKIELGAFISYKGIDGNGIFSEDTFDQELIGFSSIQEDGGLHRTAGEILDKNSLKDLQSGIYASYSLPFGTISTLHHVRKLSEPWTPTKRPDNQFNFSGDTYSKHGIFYDLVKGSFNFFGEASYASNNSLAFVAGALTSVHSKLDLSLVYRNYDRDFISLQSNGFGEASTTSNESGWFAGFEMRPIKHIKILGYYDLFKSDWLRFAADAPSSGNDFWVEANYRPKKSWEVYYRYRNETKQKNESGDNLNSIVTYTLARHRIHSSYNVNKAISLRTRVEWNTYTQGKEITNGNMVYQDIIYKPFGSKFHLSYRIASSSIEDFNNRIYSFERVPLYDYPMHNHSYSGIRTYVMVRVLPSRNLNFWLRYAITGYDNDITSTMVNPTIGSGLEETIGNNRQVLTFQVRYKIR